MIRARMVRDILELQEWCKDYMASPRCTTHDPLRRFAIGIYQIYQGIKWGENASGSESLAAAAIHFCMAGE